MNDFAVEPNRHVTFDYELRGEDGDLIDASELDEPHPIRYVHGYGMIVPGLERALAGLRAGDEREVVVPADCGYGEYDDDLVMEIAREGLPDTRIEEGDELVAQSPAGDEMVVGVLEVREDCVLVDANHPLAGMTLNYVVRIREVRPATDEEIDRAAADLDDAHADVHGPDCDHADEPVHAVARDVN